MKKYTFDEAKLIYRLWKNRMSASEIAKQTGRSKNSIQYFIYRKLNITNKKVDEPSIKKIKKEVEIEAKEVLQ